MSVEKEINRTGGLDRNRHGDVEGKRLRCAKITRALDLGKLIRDGSNPACTM